MFADVFCSARRETLSQWRVCWGHVCRRATNSSEDLADTNGSYSKCLLDLDEYVDCSLSYLLDCVDVRERVCSADNIDISVTCPSQVGMSHIR